MKKLILGGAFGIAALGIAAVVLAYSSLGGSREVFSEDVSGRKMVQFPIRVASTLGNPVKHLHVSGIEDTRIPFRIAITNRSSSPQEISWRKNSEDKKEAGMLSLAPGETQQVFNGVGQGAGVILTGLSRSSRNLVVDVDFDSPLPTGTRLKARIDWSDGP